MFHVLLIAYFVLQIPLKMFCYRVRGMKHANLDDTAARLMFWAIPNAIDAAVFSFCFLTDMRGYVIAGALITGYLSSIVEHSPWQSPSWYNYIIMGLITTGMIAIMLLPVLVLPGEHHLVAFLPLGMLGAVASWIGYSDLVRYRSLDLFGIEFCRPVVIGGSEWEEFFIGALPFGITICAVGLKLLGVY